MGGDVLVAVAVVVDGGNNMGVALDIVDNLFFKDRFENDGTCASLLHGDHFVDVGGQAAAANNDRAFEVQSEVFCASIHSILFAFNFY